MNTRQTPRSLNPMSGLRVITPVLVSISLACFSLGCLGATNYDTVSPLGAHKVLPAVLIKGEHYKVRDTVVPFQGLYKFEVDTDWGEFSAEGEAMLRLRLREFDAIAELAAISEVQAGAQAAGTSVVKGFKNMGKAFKNPKGTAAGIPAGARRMFKKADRSLNKAKKTSVEIAVTDEQSGSKDKAMEEAAAKLAKKFAGIGSKYRKWAETAGVDPYSSNPVLRAELSRLANASAVGNIGGKIFFPVMPDALALVSDAAEVAYFKDWRVLFEDNARLMRGMGVSDELTRASLRFGLGRFTTTEEIDFAVTYVADAIDRLRRL